MKELSLEETPAPKPVNRILKPSLCKVRALGWVNEGGVTYRPGDEFSVSAARRKALPASIVEDV
jgi:hypothetical protein